MNFLKPVTPTTQIHPSSLRESFLWKPHTTCGTKQEVPIVKGPHHKYKCPPASHILLASIFMLSSKGGWNKSWLTVFSSRLVWLSSVLTMKICRAKFHLMDNYFIMKGCVITELEIEILLYCLCWFVRFFFCFGRSGKKETKGKHLQLGEGTLVRGERAPSRKPLETLFISP